MKTLSRKSTKTPVTLTWMITVFLLFLGYLFLIAPSPVASSSSYNAYQYDMTGPQFTPDGRLLQVEYATSAADHSSPLLLVKLTVPKDDSQQDPTMEISETEDIVVMFAVRSRRRVQERFVIIPASGSGSGSVYGQCVVAMSGVLPDCLSLLQAVQEEALQRQRRYGSASAQLNAHDVAQCIASQCQQHAFGGGIRPYGATFVVCGLLPGAGPHGHKLAALQTDPSGAIQDLLVTTTVAPLSKTDDPKQREPFIHWVGGKSVQRGAMRASLESRLREEWPNIVAVGSAGEKLDRNYSSHLGRMISIIGKMLLEESIKTASSENSAAGPSQADEDLKEGSEVEVVIISSVRGIYKLMQGQVNKLLAQSLG